MPSPTRQGIRYLALAAAGAVLAVALVSLLTLSTVPETHSQGQDEATPTPDPAQELRRLLDEANGDDTAYYGQLKEPREKPPFWGGYKPDDGGASGESHSDCDQDTVHASAYDASVTPLDGGSNQVWYGHLILGVTVGFDLVVRNDSTDSVVASTYDSNVPYATAESWTTPALTAGTQYRLEYWPSYVSGSDVICGAIEEVTFTAKGQQSTPTPTPTPEPPEEPEVHAYWNNQTSSGGNAAGEFERVADDEDYYNFYTETELCVSGNCTTITYTVERVEDDLTEFDDCEHLSHSDCFDATQRYVSYGTLKGGDTASATIYARACKDGGYCSAYGSDTITYTKPTPTPTPIPPTPVPQLAPPPDNVTATDQSTTATETCPKVRVSWDAVTDVVRYQVEWQQEGRTTWTVAGTSTTTSLNVTGLSRTTKYKFQVRSIGDGSPYSSTAYGEPSEDTEDASATTGTCFPALAAPTAAAGADHKSIKVDYDLPQSGYNYRLQLLLVEDLDSTVQSTHDITVPTGSTFPYSGDYTFTGLSASASNTHYVATLTACRPPGHTDCAEPKQSKAVTLLTKLTTPTNLDVVPMGNRVARFKWDAVTQPSATHYVITDNRIPPGQFTVAGDTYYDVKLDLYLADDLADTFTVYAHRTGGNYLDSDPSAAIKIVDNPVLQQPGGSANGDNSDLDENATVGKAVITWQKIDNVSSTSDYTIITRRLAGDGFHHGETWNPWGGPEPAIIADTQVNLPVFASPSQLEYTKEGLSFDWIYAIQINYTETDGTEVYSGRYAYVWPAKGQPGNATLVSGDRVATYPYFGHWPDKTYTYRICEDSFQNRRVFGTRHERESWVALIESAFEQWETATGGLVTMTRNSGACHIGSHTGYATLPGSYIPIEVILDNVVTTSLDANEVYMVSDTDIAGLDERAVFGSFIEDPIGQCVFYTGSGCTISRAYYGSPSAEAELSNAAGSKKGVDILFRQSKFEVGHVENSGAPKFNHCQPTPSFRDVDNRRDEYFAYKIALHEAGHALGTSGVFDAKGLVDDLLSGSVDFSKDYVYRGAHPSIPGAVMNYNDKFTPALDEHDCSPHPFDIMAIFALYQTVPDPP